MKVHELFEGKITSKTRNLVIDRKRPDPYPGDFDCSDINLTSLEGAPQSVGGNFQCAYNNLTSLEGAPQSVGGNFDSNDNNLTSLEGAPQSVGGNFECSYNDLTSLKGAPEEVGGNFGCHHNNLTSLKGIDKTIKKIGGVFYFESNKIENGFCDILKMEHPPSIIKCDNKQVQEIINKHLSNLKPNSFKLCVMEFMENGLEDFI